MIEQVKDLRELPLFKLSKQEIQGRLALIGDERMRLAKELKELTDMDSVLRKRLNQLRVGDHTHNLSLRVDELPKHESSDDNPFVWSNH